ncbi:o-succinylbenzoate synthase [Vibrio sp. SM6]|uniref:o-succinylbenzoate synthase n=1 Tax=Vibrio agarilyticus TaxID=2726741 RepID=A0A7X8YH94_9VIBR|nr:o-succinylbenzoate synthase [Vibrio agarilyticus]NLS13868.1 o-succinylbenzoate synthase [Vibrio agarilyticus]
MKSATLYRYDLPMDSGVILRQERLSVRSGFILELKHDDILARGEVAPLPGFSHESLEQAGAQLQTQLEHWLKDEPIDFDTLYPSVAFGLSIALDELSGRLPIEGNYQVAPLCNGDPDELLAQLSELSGDKVAKIKVGLYEPIRDAMMVNLFLESIPDLSLRLDANRAWTPDKAEQFARKIPPSRRGRIAYLEEPCHHPGDSLAFAIDTGIAIAWDETLQDALHHSHFDLSDLTGAKVIVIKPTLIGSTERCRMLVEKAATLGIKAVISSSLESSLGLNLLARMAYWLTPEQVPGLDTVSLFKAQLDQPWPDCLLDITPLHDQTRVWHQTV